MKRLLALVCFLTSACVSPASGPVYAIACPVQDAASARRIGEAVIAAHARPEHFSQANYRLDLEDKGRFWVALDGPHLPEVAAAADENPGLAETGDETIVVQAGGEAFSFRIAKCAGAISEFRVRVWR